MSSEQVETTLPWMNREYFQSILIKYEGRDDLELREFKVKAGTNKGENFASAIYRVSMNYLLLDQPKELIFIVKTSPESSLLSDMLDEMGTFAVESFFYTNLKENCEKLIPNFKIAPRLIHVDKRAMVFEDLLKLDFKLADRMNRLDFNKAKIVIKKLAQYHATTAVAHQKNPKLMDLYLNSAINVVEETPITFFFAMSIQETLQTLKRTPELQSYVNYVENFDIVAKEKNVFTRSADDRFHVLNHGDLWINNIFFSFDNEDKPIETILIDFQECFWGSPGIDLNHFFFTSCDIDIHENYIEELIALYHQQLSAVLSELKFSNIPTLEDIQWEVARKSDQGLITLCSIVPVMMIENPEHAAVENFIADAEGVDEIRREIYGNPKYIEILKKLLPKVIHEN